MVAPLRSILECVARSFSYNAALSAGALAAAFLALIDTPRQLRWVDNIEGIDSGTTRWSGLMPTERKEWRMSFVKMKSLVKFLLVVAALAVVPAASAQDKKPQPVTVNLKDGQGKAVG